MQELLHSDALDRDAVLARNAACVYRLAYSRAHRKADAEDIFQEVFLRWTRANPTFQTEIHERAWFIRVTLNVMNSYYRKADRRRTVSVAEPPAPYEDEDDFELLLLALPEDERVDVHLFYAERMSVREIAKITGRSENAVRIRLTRARKLLRQSLEGGDVQ